MLEKAYSAMMHDGAIYPTTAEMPIAASFAET
jgi:hypothetical protein